MKLFSSSIFIFIIVSAVISVPGQAAVHNLTVTIDQAQESTPTGSPGTGSATMTYDDVSGELSWNISWTGLIGGAAIAMHFHGPAAPGINAGIQVNCGAISGLTSPSIGSEFISAPQAADLLNDLFYINIHTAQFPGGEIRGQVLTALPVELIAFKGVVQDQTLTLNWETASENNNAGFEVQTQQLRHWQTMGFVEGHGSTSEAQSYTYYISDLTPGTHSFRLKQVDFDGAFVYSPKVEATIDVPQGIFLSEAYPNPFNPSTTFTVILSTDQQVRVEAFDVFGRSQAVLFEGALAAQKGHVISFRAGSLPSGLYLLRVSGEQFSATRSVTLLK